MKTSLPWADLAASYHGKRLEWADEAYNQFLDELPNEVSASLSRRRGDSNVTLYGPTQVGKTTLLLTLLGVREERMGFISEVLRAGRPFGNSATATAMRYHASDGNTWTWQVMPGDRTRRPEEVSGDQIRKRLTDLRADVEAGRWDPGKTVEVGLPADCFNDDAGFRVKVLDLPGVSGRDPGERRHAQRLADERIAISDMVLLIGRVNQLGFLAPAALTSDGLRNWVHLTERFGVVLTFAYTNGTVAEWLSQRNGKVLSLEEMRQRLVKELAKHEMPLPQVSGADWLYPLEFGRSWDDAVPDQETRILRDGTLSRLRDDLVRGSRPEARIRHAGRAGHVAQAVRKQRRQELDVALADAKELHGAAQRRLEARKEAVREHDKKRPNFQQFHGYLDDQLHDYLNNPDPHFGVLALVTFPSDWTFTGRDSEPVDEICDALRDSFRKAISDWHKIETETRRGLPVVVSAAIGSSDRTRNDLLQRFETVLADNFDDIRNWIYHKFLKRRFLTWSKSREEVTDLVRNAHATVARELRRQLAGLAGNRLGLYKQQLNQHEQALQGTRRALVSRVEAAKLEVKEMDARASRVDADRKKRLAELRAAETAAEKFPDRLQSKFEEARSALIREAAIAGGQLPALAAAIAVLDRALVYDSIKGG